VIGPCIRVGLRPAAAVGCDGRMSVTMVMRRIVAGLLVVPGLALAAAAPGRLCAQSTSERPAPQSSLELPPELSRVLRDYEQYWSKGQADELAALFVEDGLIVRRGSWIRGRDGIREAYRNTSGPLRLRAIEYATGGDVGFIVGAYGYGGDTFVEDTGVFVLTLKRQSSGVWLIVSDLDRGAS